MANDSRRSKSVKPAWFGPWSKGRIALWTVLGLLVALVTALVLAPASMADWGLKVATHGRVRLADASGSIWHGQGKVVLVDVAALAARERDKPDAVLPLPGVLVPGTIRWDIQVLPLLIGRVQVLARHDSMAQPVEISGTFARPRFSAGSIRLPNVSLSRLGSPWSTVQPGSRSRSSTARPTAWLPSSCVTWPRPSRPCGRWVPTGWTLTAARPTRC